MDEQEVIEIPADEIEIIDIEDYRGEVAEHFHQMPDVARPLMSEAKQTFHKIEQMLYSAPAFINAVKAAIPDVTLQAVLTDDQKSQLAKGALKLMTKKDGSLMANLVNQETNKIVSTIPLKSVQLAPEMTQAMTSFSTQMAQIAEQIQVVQLAVEEVRQGQEYDRLATAYSCQQKLLQAMAIKGKPAPNDWYEFVEYSSMNKRSIEIQKYGFSRESALYILQHEAEYVYKSETELKLKKSLLKCPNKGVKADAELAWYNTPELFLEEDT